MKIDLIDDELDLLKASVHDRINSLREYRAFLCDGRGNKLAGVYTAIGQVDQDIKEAELMLAKLFGIE